MSLEGGRGGEVRGGRERGGREEGGRGGRGGMTVMGNSPGLKTNV